MHRGFAIACRCSHRRERFQLAFARAAAQILPEQAETSYESTGAGLTLLAETEISLERPLERLRSVDGDEVRIAAPEVRYRRAARTEEPHMGLRILCGVQSFDQLLWDLLARGARVLDSEVNSQFGVLRATAPLASLIGYPAHVTRCSDGRARLTMWLSHYAPVDDNPPGGDAA